VSGERSVTKLNPSDFGPLLGDAAARALSPRRVSGGFNCVAQVSAEMARRVFARQVTPPALAVPITADAMRAFVEEHREELSEAVRSLSFDQGANYFLRVELGAPSQLSFQNPHQVRVVFEGRVRLTKTEPAPTGPALITPTASIKAAPPFAALLPIDVALELLHGEGGPEPVEAERGLVAELGQASLELTCDYHASPEPKFVRCDVLAKLKGADSKLSIAAGDGRLFVEELGGPQATMLLQQVSAAPEVKLTPTISVVGQNPAGAVVREFTECSVEAFHLDQGGRQALAIAFDLMPGCHGIVEEVEAFLCGRDFGVVSDEWTVSRVLKNKWRLGGFYRHLNTDIGVRIKHGDREEDASVHFDVSLDGLDVAVLETDANTRADRLRIGGPATATARFLRLQDGSVYGPDKVDLGEPTTQVWTVNTTPALDETQSSEWQLRLFQMEASHDAYRHLGRPFANFPDQGVDVDYTRVEGVEKFIFCLGNSQEVFL